MADTPNKATLVVRKPLPAPPKSKAVSLPKSMLAAGIAACTAEAITLPLDTIKVRLQLFPGKYTGFTNCAKSIHATEGVGAFWKGLQAGLMRQTVFGSLRIGLFDYGMQYLVASKGEENIGFLDRAGLGILTGAFAMCVANPTDVVKVRLQAEIKGPGDGPPQYKSAIDAFQKIWASEGWWGFYQSLGPNILRNATFNAIELASYSQIKYEFSKGTFKWFDEGIYLHLWSSSCAGILAVVFGSPFDVVKSRIMNGETLSDGKKIPYKSLFDCVKKTYGEGGVLTFYKGFTANCQRMVSWNVCMFVLREQILDYFKSKNY